MEHISQVADKSGITAKVYGVIQPLACPFCSAPRLGIAEAMHVYKCKTKIFIRPTEKPKAERSVECVERKK